MPILPARAERPGPRRAGALLFCGARLRSLAVALSLAPLLLGPTGSATGQIRFWVDEQGVTHFSDDPEAPPSDAEPTADPERLRSAWGDRVIGPPVASDSGDSSGEASRVRRLLRGALADLERGENARAEATLRGLLRLEPRQPEAHWYLASLARGRGRFATAERHLRLFLDAAGPDLAAWRAEASQRLAVLEKEQALADPEALTGPLELETVRSTYFRVQLDERLGKHSTDYAARVLQYLDEARAEVSSAIGVEPLEPLGVVLYAKAAYVRAHAHRFSFQTVGFFDGRIHVASPAEPNESLRGLLFHEYAHAIFREQTGGDRPYWFNEGLAEMIERRARGRGVSTRSERAALRTNIETGSWLPLDSIADSFSGLTDELARNAYLQSVFTVGYLRSQTDVDQRRRLLQQLGRGFSIDQALHEILGLDTAGLDRAVRREIRAEFPEWTTPASP